MESMTTRDYERYRQAIEAANDTRDKEALRQIQKQLIARYGLDNEDVKKLLRKFRFTAL